ncbi:tRNA (adenosine(37)-N6)-threonylcarbamoyltransferase complex ATPase subunit type 1 TsaE [Desulfonatronospira sp.]|uniref:tRNA (adenosine(37)-N6)-threonylcarbamoyltransferase complex ATPase subunit type 1 TsaE n=1 Tax=Desulfonatronospira sp. TaxID=1962951 RepID=UPI0025C4A370|nr:tRNA (adenosine(37)-N6)-threonylcarbamoyltransferase complex ATPase subunit type 1 TsaE [Desulfonatronospira sp.]
MSSVISLILSNEAATIELGRKMGLYFTSRDFFPAVFFCGDLGTGKTTMIRGIVSALPGGEDAEVSSPSFNLANIYPTRPETLHVDLYRLQGLKADQDVEELLAGVDRLILVEWGDFLPEGQRPRDRVDIVLKFYNGSREALINLSGAGEKLRSSNICG